MPNSITKALVRIIAILERNWLSRRLFRFLVVAFIFSMSVAKLLLMAARSLCISLLLSSNWLNIL